MTRSFCLRRRLTFLLPILVAIVGLPVFTAGPRAQSAPPLGVWTGAGAYCVAGIVVDVPPGVEAISFGRGVELRLADGPDLGELLVGRGDSDRAPSLWSLRQRWEQQHPCRSGQTLEAKGPMKIGTADDTIQAGWVALSCEAAERADFGLFAAAGRIATEDPLDLVWLMFAFGSEDFQLGRQNFRADKIAGEAAALDSMRHFVRHWRVCSGT